LKLGIWILPFDLAQGGELVEPFVICNLVLGILFIARLKNDSDILFDLFRFIVGRHTSP
jgi:hypothetical protein